MNGIDLTGIHKIVILYYGLLGDVLMNTPILRTLKSSFPDAEIYIFSDNIGSYALENNPYIKKIFTTNRSKSNKLNYVAQKIRSQVQLRLLKADLIIDLYGGSSTHTMMKLSGIKYQIGFNKGLLWTNGNLKINKEFDISKLDNPLHLSNNAFKALSFLPDEKIVVDVKPMVFSTEEISKKIKKHLQAIPNYKNEYYLLSLGSGGLEKLLPTEKLYLLIEYIYKKYKLKPAIIHNPGQEFLKKQLIEDYLIKSGFDYLEFPSFSISEIIHLMYQSKLIIVPDTGLFHIAVGVGIPIFTIFTYTHPILVKPESGIYKLVCKETEEKDHFGAPVCTKNIDDKYIQQQLDEFLLEI